MKKLATLLFVCICAAHFGFAQNALSFDGTDDKVDLGNPTSLQITGTAITVEAWIYPTSWRLNVWEGDIVVKEQPIHGGYMFRAGDNGKLNFAWGNGTTWNELTTNSGQLTLNTWQHVAATYDGQMVRLYKNGMRIDSTNYTGSIVTNSNSCVIGGWFSTGRNFPGKIDEVRIWNVTRSQQEIMNAMNGEFCSAPVGLQGYYKFNQGTAGGNNAGATTLTDLSGNGNHGTLQNFSLSGSTSNWTTGKTLTPGTGGSGTANVNGCDSYTSPSGKYTWTSNGTYTDTVTSPLGCDSIVTINLTLQSSSTGSMTATACNDFTSPSGNFNWNTSGTFYDTLTNSVGCDSVLTIALTIHQIDTAVLQNGAVLTSWENGASYQWLDCNNNFAPVAGATNQTFHPAANGSYAVEVTANGCNDTSRCYVVTGVGITENQAFDFNIFPQPAAQQIQVVCAEWKNTTLEIFSVDGRKMNESELTSNHTKIAFDLPSGMYVVVLTNEKGSATQKLIIE